jgi:hypothetical protein
VKKPGYEILALERDLPGGPVSVEVRLADGYRWGASFYTPEDIRTILDRWRAADGRSGLYFWAPGVIVVRETTREAIVAVVEDLVTEGDLELAFERVGDGKAKT